MSWIKKAGRRKHVEICLLLNEDVQSFVRASPNVCYSLRLCKSLRLLYHASCKVCRRDLHNILGGCPFAWWNIFGRSRMFYDRSSPSNPICDYECIPFCNCWGESGRGQDECGVPHMGQMTVKARLPKYVQILFWPLSQCQYLFCNYVISEVDSWTAWKVATKCLSLGLLGTQCARYKHASGSSWWHDDILYDHALKNLSLPLHRVKSFSLLLLGTFERRDNMAVLFHRLCPESSASSCLRFSPGLALSLPGWAARSSSESQGTL